MSNNFYPAPEPTAEQIEGADMLAKFLRKNNCAAMTREGEIIILSDLEKAHKYKDSHEPIDIPTLSITGCTRAEFERVFKSVISRLALLQVTSRKNVWDTRNKNLKKKLNELNP